MTKVALCLIFLVSVAAMYSQTKRDIVVDNTAVYQGNDQWEWTIFIKSSPDVLGSIDYVQYTLHSTFDNPIQKVYKTADPDRPFGLTRTGWGVFEIPVRIVFKDGEQQTLQYLLRFQKASEGSKCKAPFVITQRQYRRIGDDFFKNAIYVYVGEIHRDTKKPFYSAVFVGTQSSWNNERNLRQSDFDKKMKQIAEDHRWFSKLRDIGDSVAFQDLSRPYHLELVNVTSDSRNSRMVSLRVCEY